VREGGDEGEGRYGAEVSVSARWGFEAAGAALNVFSSLSTRVNACVLSNGVLLESQ
jgi:hypothetical protein